MITLDETRVAEIRRLQAERDHWKANHDNQVAIKSALISRPDLCDRAPRIEKLIAENARLREERDRDRNALEVADEILALIEDVGHGASSENVTAARRVVLDALGPE